MPRHFLSLILLTCGALALVSVMKPNQLRHASAAALPQAEFITPLGTLGGADSYAFGINTAGQVVGYAANDKGAYHAFVWQNGQMRDLGTLPNFKESFAWAINDAGQIAGTSNNLGDLQPRAFRWQNGTMTDAGTFAPRAINRNGEMAGTLHVKRNNVDWYEHACVWRNNTLTDLGTLGGDYSYAHFLDDSGRVVGIANTANEAATHAFAWSNGTMRDLGTLGGASSQAYALNANAAVGYSETSAGAAHAFLYALDASGAVATRTDLGGATNGYSYAYAVNQRGQVVGTNGHAVLWQNGGMIDLNDLLPPDSGWVLTTATGINDEGKIVGNGKFYGFPQGFVLGRIANTTTTSVSAANYATRLAPAAISAIFGQNLATTTQTASTSVLPTTLGGTQVTVRDSAGVLHSAALFFVSPSQVNFLMPAEAASGAAEIFITNANDVLAFGTTQIAAVAPGIFSANATGQGVAAAVALRVKADGTQTYEAVNRFDTAQNKFVTVPLDLGTTSDQLYLLLFGTGIRGRSNLANVGVKIKNLDATVSFAGPQGLAGLDQINALIPRATAGSGEVEIRVTVDGQAANPVLVQIK
jgi:uncharacterized protein (TIGR03437 family)